jgi:hypothetical protein
MRKISSVLLLMVGMLGLGWQDVNACGDKFLVVGHGARFQRGYCVMHPASILVYVNPKSKRAAAMGDPQLLDALKSAGHKPQTVSELGKFDNLLASNRFDIVLADMTDAAAVEQQLHISATKPLLLPIMYKPSKADLAAATQRYGAVLKAPDHLTHFLSVIDDVMKARHTGIRAAISE